MRILIALYSTKRYDQELLKVSEIILNNGRHCATLLFTE